MTKDQWRKRQEQWRRFNAWESEQIRESKITPHEAFRIFDELYQEARTLGVLNVESSAEDLKAQVRVAAILNSGLHGD